MTLSNTSYITIVAGKIEYRDIYVKETVDVKYNVIERLAIKPIEGTHVKPRIIVFDEKGKKIKEYEITYGSYLMYKEGDFNKTRRYSF